MQLRKRLLPLVEEETLRKVKAVCAMERNHIRTRLEMMEDENPAILTLITNLPEGDAIPQAFFVYQQLREEAPLPRVTEDTLTSAAEEMNGYGMERMRKIMARLRDGDNPVVAGYLSHLLDSDSPYATLELKAGLLVYVALENQVMADRLARRMGHASEDL